MKNKMLTLMLGMIFLLTIMASPVSAEMSFWTEISLNYDEQTASQTGYYQYDDTSARGIGRNKPIDLMLWAEHNNLPFDLSGGGYAGYVDWCNLTVTHSENEYGTTFLSFLGITSGEYLGTTKTIDNYYYANVSAGYEQLFYDMRDKDSINYIFTCHYTDASSVFVESILFGKIDAYFGAYECDDCDLYSLEELSNQVERNEAIAEEQTEIYDKIQSIIDMNFKVWLIISWIIKIAFIFTAIGLIFSGIYWLYLLFKNIEDEI